jgi:hypothetical protein
VQKWGKNSPSLQVYEKLNIARIETWNQLRVDPQRAYSLDYDPNAELEWRNQATAHTDCFLYYKVCVIPP